MSRVGIDPFVTERSDVFGSNQHVEDVVAGDVSALDQRGVGTHLDERLTGLEGGLLVGRFDACQDDRLVGVRRDECRLGDEFFVSVLGVGFEEAVARGGDHHRIDDECGEVLGVLDDRFDDLAGREHSSLGCPDVEILEHGLDLGLDVGNRQEVAALNAGRVLSRDTRDRARPEPAHCLDCLEVGLDPRAAAGVAAGYRQHGRGLVRGLVARHSQCYSVVV
ncbi:hypothetical protein HTIA_2542 [Halorhabdus tiamatea SARL4B]|uniref:Uncharacterized protein n=1 Tax=Halorhabdus tiamatea SARL4B TaxID=1033806 RepID=S6D235_9EURY|nr:hypothetical protein HTIA_2542 [Halorhabdus tiamatea SARL4B]